MEPRSELEPLTCRLQIVGRSHRYWTTQDEIVTDWFGAV
jgi:hypothetical protein